MTYRILLSGGGTAGSVTPLIALAEKIRPQRNDVEFLFLGTASGPEQALAQAANISFTTIPGGKLRRYWSIKNFSDVVQILRGYQAAKKVIRTWNPQVVVSAGSFISVPVIWAAHRMGIATLIHQQDVQPGLANRLMAPAADRITLAFAATQKFFAPHRSRLIGNPIRLDILTGNATTGRQRFHLSDRLPILLIIGGGTGSLTLNQVATTLLPTLVEHWSIVHVTGQQREGISFRHPRYQQHQFVTANLPHLLAMADVVVSRAGCGLLSELAALGKATIFIPMPSSHQEENAQVVAQAKAGVVVEQGPQLGERLGSEIERLRTNPVERSRLGQSLRQFHQPAAAEHLADEVLQLMHTKI